MASSLSSLPSWVTIAMLFLYHQMGPFGVMSNEDLILPSFSWDPRNECFNSSQTDDGYAHIRVDQDSQMYFLCPSSVITLDVQTSRPLRKNMYENMYMTTKEEFDSCEIKNIDDDNTRLVMKCDEPLYKEKLKFKHFSFTSFRSSMSGYEFHAGKTYYFIATSDGSAKGLNGRKGGRCQTNNMRLAITICKHGMNCHVTNRRCTKDGGFKSKNSLKKSAVKVVVDKSPKAVQIVKTTKPPTTPPQQPVVPSVSDPKLLRSIREPESSSENYAVYIALAAAGGLIIGIILTFMFLKLQKKASQDGMVPSLFCCDKRSKLRLNEKVTQQPLC